MFKDSLIEIFSSQMGVSRSGNDFENSVINSENTNIESTTSEIKNENIFFTLFFVQSVGNGGCSGLIQYSDNI